ncbi:hypothetical protein CH267_15795 [Rhodococcus sp. 06-621-2]|nr:PaaX family transcriptional regulator C-terminal domain-containing protein [Rhodococcus sp. 06-621-2]OZC53666.1 hypothetical protein CH267_15795 [Rhodococcus sp. 06-621-2]
MVSYTGVFPRDQQGAQPQRLVTTLLGDYWFRRDEHLPSGALVQLLHDFGVSAPSARAAIRRVATRGLLTTSKQGRNAAYGIPADGQDVIASHMRTLFDFGSEPIEWDGQWTIVAFSVPEGDRDTRRALRDGLRRLQFGTLFDAVWVSPHDRGSDALALANTLGLSNVTVIRGEELSARTIEEVVPTSFDLPAVAEKYHEFLHRYSVAWGTIDPSTVPEVHALRLRTEIMTDWRIFPSIDPGLPDVLLPADWPRDAARKLCMEVYDTLGAEAESRFRRVVAQYNPALAELVSHHTFADWMSTELAGR